MAEHWKTRDLMGIRLVTSSDGPMEQNLRGEWIPAMPIPLFVGWRLKRCQCVCGRKFPDLEEYRGHYALRHILALP